MIPVVRQLILNEHKDENAAGHPYGQTGYIDDGNRSKKVPLGFASRLTENLAAWYNLLSSVS